MAISTLPGLSTYNYETVAAGQTAQVLGGVGAKGDYLHRLIISVNTVATASVTLLDGATSIALLAGAATLVPGVLSIEINLLSASGPWSITTGAGATVIGVGLFSA
jgi:hypothetical protein